MGSKYCMHAHVGFMAHGQINVRFADGCVVEYKAPKFVQVEPGHEGWVVGDEPAVLIEFDFEGDTVNRLGVPQVHKHGELIRMVDSSIEPWLRGPLAGVHPLVAPTLHAYAQAREDLARWTRRANRRRNLVAAARAGASRISAPPHRGQRRSSHHLPARRATHAGTTGGNPARNGSRVQADRLCSMQVNEALHQSEQVIRALDPATLEEPRSVGRRQLPTTVIGLVVHLAEHTQRHVGELIVTAKLARKVETGRTRPSPS